MAQTSYNNRHMVIYALSDLSQCKTKFT